MTHQREIQSIQDSLDAVYKLLNDLEGKFIEMGQLFAHIKARKLYHFKGYESFRDYIEQEHNISLGLANKLIKIQDLFIGEMDQDEETLKEIGMDRLIMIAPLVAKEADIAAREELLQMAYLPIPELKAEVKRRKEDAKAEDPDLKKILVDQWKQFMCEQFNCTWSEMQFKLALLFTSPTKMDPLYLGALKVDISKLQKQFEAEETNADR